MHIPDVTSHSGQLSLLPSAGWEYVPSKGQRGVVVVAVVGCGFHRCLSVCLSACPSVCLSVYAYNISKTDAARITKLDIRMFYEEERWKLICFGVRRSR